MSIHERINRDYEMWKHAAMIVKQWNHREDQEEGDLPEDSEFSLYSSFFLHWLREHTREPIEQVEIDHFVAYKKGELILSWRGYGPQELREYKKS